MVGSDVSELPQTFGELKSSGYQPLPVKAEIRRNLIAKLRSRESLFPGVMGYNDTVIPQLTNAILGNQDIILLGERGQAKSRIVRSLVTLLDEWTPVLTGTEIPEDPFQPITAQGRQIIEEQGDSAPITWLHRDERYADMGWKHQRPPRSRVPHECLQPGRQYARVHACGDQQERALQTQGDPAGSAALPRHRQRH